MFYFSGRCWRGRFTNIGGRRCLSGRCAWAEVGDGVLPGYVFTPNISISPVKILTSGVLPGYVFTPNVSISQVKILTRGAPPLYVFVWCFNQASKDTETGCMILPDAPAKQKSFMSMMHYCIVRNTFFFSNESIANEELFLVYYTELTQGMIVSGYIFPMFQWAN